MATRRQLFTAGLAALSGVGALTGCSSGPKLARNGRPPKEFGVAIDPWHVSDWATAVGAQPTTVMEFESWDRNRSLAAHFRAARDDGLKSYVITWEPWAPVDPALGKKAEGALQPKFSNKAIAAGKLDDYITMFARDVKKSGLTVYIRYAHEMSGDWYPWSNDADAYIQGWRHIVERFRAVGADNAKFIFAPGADIYDPDDAAWLGRVRRYWPGAEYVDYLGTTMISFGGKKTYQVSQFTPRLTLLHDTYGQEVFLAEVNSAAKGRLVFFTDLRTWLDTPQADWIKGVVLSQRASRGQVVLGDLVGDLSWQVVDDPVTKPVIRAMIRDIT